MQSQNFQRAVENQVDPVLSFHLHEYFLQIKIRE